VLEVDDVDRCRRIRKPLHCLAIDAHIAIRLDERLPKHVEQVAKVRPSL